MPTYLFNYKERPIKKSFRVEAKDIDSARVLLYFFISRDDPYGYMITLQHIISSFQIMEKAEAELLVNKEIRDLGFSQLEESMQ